MFGTNVLRKQEKGTDGLKLFVQSTFSTIQGEGPFAGKPSIFLRLSGCNLRCTFCDTDFESKRTQQTVKEIIKEIDLQAVAGKVFATKLVVITGGEPLIQNIRPLCAELVYIYGYDVQIETAGTVWVDGLEDLIRTGRVTLVCSPKTGSVHEMIQKWCMNWKYLIREGEVSLIDGLPEMSTQIEGKKQKIYRPIPTPQTTIWLQPCEEYDVVAEKINIDHLNSEHMRDIREGELSDQKITSSVRNKEKSRRNVELAAAIAMKYNYRISVQLHKILGLP